MKDKVIFSVLMASLMQLMSFRDDQAEVIIDTNKNITVIVVEYNGKAPIHQVAEELNLMIAEWSEYRGRAAVYADQEGSKVLFAAPDPITLERFMGLIRDDIAKTQKYIPLPIKGNIIGLS